MSQRFHAWGSLLTRRKEELLFVGDATLIAKAYRDFVTIPSTGNSGPSDTQISIKVGKRHIMATFLSGFEDIISHIPPIEDHKNTLRHVVILCDINKQIELSRSFRDKISSYGRAALWLTGVWAVEAPLTVDPTIKAVSVQGQPEYKLNLEQKTQELNLRNGALRQSLKKGAHYRRWSDHDQSLRGALDAFINHKDAKTSPQAQIDPKAKTFKFSDGNTASEITSLVELTAEDFIIAVIGPTGSGKSTFIKNATGCNIKIGDDLESCTSEVHVVRVVDGDSKIYIVDTPGFDDTSRSNLEIFQVISEFLKMLAINHVYLSGLVYFQRISDNRMGTTTLRNVKMFEKLCGRDCFHKVTLATTMWDELESIGVGEMREKHLIDDAFALMLTQGAKLVRLEHNETSAKSLISMIISSAKELRPLALQKEILAEKDLAHTKAGRVMYSNLDDVVQAHQDAVGRLSHNIRDEKSEEGRLELSEECNVLAVELTDIIADMQYMQLSLPARLLLLFRRAVGKGRLL